MRKLLIAILLSASILSLTGCAASQGAISVVSPIINGKYAAGQSAEYQNSQYKPVHIGQKRERHEIKLVNDEGEKFLEESDEPLTGESKPN